MDNAKQQIVDTIKNKSNILVTVSTNPSVDELSAALGLTILLNDMEKRATAVFSGAIPPAISFLEPDKTFEDTADSLRDFIIALDKEKADHLRYKVDGDVVKIFITPYRTKLSHEDLDFSQGDYNVEMVIALGVKDQDHLDNALAAHGKILHDAAVVTVTVGENKSSLGSTDWHNDSASSLSEMVASLADGLKEDKSLLDEQISTALLTGIVSATERFSNDKTSSQAMTIAAQLMASGANQQLIAAKLEEAHDIEPKATEPAAEIVEKNDDAQAPEQKPAEKTNELVINRAAKSKDGTAVTADAQSEAAAVTDEKETLDQIELEKQLSGIIQAPTGTMEDIEKGLREAGDDTTAAPVSVADIAEPAEQASPEVPVDQPAVEAEEPQTEAQPEPEITIPPLPEPEPTPLEPQPAPVVDDTQFTAATDAAMPGFEETAPAESAFTMPPLPDQPSAEEQPVLPELSPVVSEHPAGSFSDAPAPQAPLNSIQSDPTEGEANIVDPFSMPPLTPSEPSSQPPVLPQLTPLPSLDPLPTSEPTSYQAPATSGTDEGAAILGATDPFTMPDPIAPTLGDPTDITIPELPPLPPLPSTADLPPLPPPPPLPDFSVPTINSMPSGAVSADQLGDIFGDANKQEITPAPQPPSPGQFKIPGQ